MVNKDKKKNRKRLTKSERNKIERLERIAKVFGISITIRQGDILLPVLSENFDKIYGLELKTLRTAFFFPDERAIGKLHDDSFGYLSEMNSRLAKTFRKTLEEKVLSGELDIINASDKVLKSMVEEHFTNGIVEIDRRGKKSKFKYYVRPDGSTGKKTKIIKAKYTATTRQYTRMLVRTTVKRARTLGRIDAALKSGIVKKWMSIAVLDRRTQPSHAARHGKIFDMDEPLKPPYRPQCRCSMSWIYNKEGKERGFENPDKKEEKKLREEYFEKRRKEEASLILENEDDFLFTEMVRRRKEAIV